MSITEQPSLATAARGAGRDLAPQRRQRLALLIASRRGARLQELSTALGVSVATVRRDLDVLKASGTLRRVHGGVVVADMRMSELEFDIKAAEAADEKRRIAEKAIEMIEPKDTVYLDGGSTVLGLARLLRGWTQVTVVTNSVPVVVDLLGRGPRLIIVGGEVRSASQAIVGPLTRLVLDQVHVDRAFIGTFGLSLTEGLTTTDPSEAYTKELVLGRARQTVVLADSRKIGTSSFVRAGGLDRVDVLVTDVGIDDISVRTLERRGIQVIKA